MELWEMKQDEGMPVAATRDRRDFLKVCTMAAAAVGLSEAVAEQMAEAAAKGLKPSVIWLHFQECTGCTESLLRTSHPDLAELILSLVSLDYHETLFAAAGHQAEAALEKAMVDNAGKYVLVIEGAIPEKDGGIYCKIGGKTALEIVNKVAAKAGAIVAIGSCASWGGIPSADPNPTGATGAPMVLKGKTVVTIPGCPANPHNLLGVVLQYAVLGTLPKLDDKGRPLFAYGRTIHEHCPRRAHFDAGRFVTEWGDDGHKKGWCLYKMGCKGPEANFNCPIVQWNDHTSWPIRAGHGCIACASPRFWDNMSPFYDRLPMVHGFGVEASASHIGAGLLGSALVGVTIHGLVRTIKPVPYPVEAINTPAPNPETTAGKEN